MFPSEQPSKDVDEKANAYFQAIYNRGMSVDQLLEVLRQFKESQNKKEKVCIIVLFYCSSPLYLKGNNHCQHNNLNRILPISSLV